MKSNFQRTKRDGTPFEPEIPLWRSMNNADVYSVVIDEAIYDMIQKMEIGGRLFLKRVVAKEGQELSAKAPQFRISATSRADQEAFANKNTFAGKKGGGRKTPVSTHVTADLEDDAI